MLSVTSYNCSAILHQIICIKIRSTRGELQVINIFSFIMSVVIQWSPFVLEIKLKNYSVLLFLELDIKILLRLFYGGGGGGRETRSDT